MSRRDASLTATSRAFATASLDVSVPLREWAGMRAERYAAIARVGGVLQTAGASEGRFGATMTRADLFAIEEFVAELRFAFETRGVLAPDHVVDEQYSRDGYSHHIDREKL